MPKAWIDSTLRRYFPAGEPPAKVKPLVLAAARGERISLQVGFRSDEMTTVRASAWADEGLRVRVRRIGYVPMPHHNPGMLPDECDGLGLLPGYVPDPLFPDAKTEIGPWETCGFWITVDVARNAKPGKRETVVELVHGKDQKETLRATVLVADAILAKRKDFRVGHWFYCDALADYYGVEPFSAKFWPICENYMRNYAEHGNDYILAPMFTPSTDGVKSPNQLVLVKKLPNGVYRFDWRHARRFVALARKCGIPYFQHNHFFTQWGCEFAIRVYEKRDGQDRLLWPPNTKATSKTYRNFLSQYLPALQRFLEEEKLQGKVFFSVSDEPHKEDHLANYRAARGMLREIAPWMRVTDALSDIRYGRENLTDLPIPSIAKAPAFLAEGIRCWTYFAGQPRGRYINRNFETPLWKLRMLGWVCHRVGVEGFLHWGYNYWQRQLTRELIDPFIDTNAGHSTPYCAYGNPFMVYPGPNGEPIDSVRGEILAESFQDIALLQTLGVDRESKVLSPLKDFQDFPREQEWILNVRRKLLS